MDFSIDYYTVLQTPQNSSFREIKKAYKKQALIWHPDKNLCNEIAASEQFKKVIKAYEILGDEEQRSKYDLLRKKSRGNVEVIIISDDENDPKTKSEAHPDLQTDGKNRRKTKRRSYFSNLFSCGTSSFIEDDFECTFNFADDHIELSPPIFANSDSGRSGSEDDAGSRSRPARLNSIYRAKMATGVYTTNKCKKQRRV